MRKLTSLAIVCTAIVILVGCNSCGKKGGNHTMPPSNSSNTQLWKKYDTPPGADPSVPDSLGGTGFEKIAEKMGFVTNIAKEEDLKYFGDSRAKTGGELKLITTRFLLSFRIYGQDANYVENSYIQSLCYESLLGTHPITQEYMPALATHWKISDDKMTYTFRLNPNARFWDGSPLTAEDVVATWKLVMDEGLLEPSLQQTYGKFETPIAKSKYIVEVKCKTKNFRNILYFGASLSILSAKEIGAMTGKEFLEKYRMNLPVGSGEYIILPQDIKNQQSYAFTRRDDYWAKDEPTAKYAGNFDRIMFTVVRDNRPLEYEMFKKGESDVFRHNAATTDKWIEDKYPALENNWCSKIRILTQGPWGTQGYAMNMRKAPFNDVRVRRAMGYLLNREAIISKLLFNEYEPANSHFDRTIFESPDVEKVQFNPEKAIQLLAEAGWKTKNAEGILVKDGKPFEVDLSIVKELERYVIPYQQELKKVGIKMNVVNEDQNADWKKKMERKFEITRMNWTGLLTPNPETAYHSRLANLNDNTNLSGVADPRIDALCAQYDTTFDKAGQIKIIRQIDKILDEIYPEVMEWHPRGIRMGIWNKFGIPEWGFPRSTQYGYADMTIMTTWWYDADKNAQLEEARTNNKKIDENSLGYPAQKGTSNEFIWDYWAKFKDQ